MNILITGIHGFVGSNLVVALKERHGLYGLDIVTPEKDGVIKTFSWDDLDKEMPEFDAVIHLAGKAHDTKNRNAADTYFKINTGLTQRIFDWFLARPSIKKFIFFSTVKSAADSVQGDILTEECVPVPIGPYGESKIKAENYIIERIEELCEKKHMSRYRLAQKSGIAQSSISTLLNRKSVPTIQTLEKICDGFGITLSQFFAEDDKVLDLTKDQEELLKYWNSMDSRQQELVKAYIQGIIRK